MSPQRGLIGVAADLYDDAEAEGARNSWSALRQLEHWTRLGRMVDRHATSALDGIRAGTVPWADLTPSELYAVNSVIDLQIEQAAGEVELGFDPMARSHPVVALDDAGALVRFHPDGRAEHVDPTP